MKLFITGGSGFIGQHLIKALASRSSLQHASSPLSLTLLTRNPDTTRRQLAPLLPATVACELVTQPESLEGYDGVINLAGEPIANRRWSRAQKKRICDSRWQLTAEIARLIRQAQQPPSVLLSGSAVGYYGDQGQREVTEQTRPHDEFTHQICRQWEAHALEASSRQTRVCLLRTGLVLGREQGLLKRLLPLYKLGLGGPLGSGRQYQPWIHVHDHVRAMLFLLDHEQAAGPFNLSAPQPVTASELSATLAQVLHRPNLMRTPAPLLRLALGELAGMLLGGQDARPEALIQSGFSFDFPGLKPALVDLLG